MSSEWRVSYDLNNLSSFINIRLRHVMISDKKQVLNEISPTVFVVLNHSRHHLAPSSCDGLWSFSWVIFQLSVMKDDYVFISSVHAGIISPRGVPLMKGKKKHHLLFPACYPSSRQHHRCSWSLHWTGERFNDFSMLFLIWNVILAVCSAITTT
jgi:hypothetical protein